MCTAPLVYILYTIYTSVLGVLSSRKEEIIMSVEIVRSPSKLFWHVMFNNVVVGIGHTKREANEMKAEYDRKLGGMEL